MENKNVLVVEHLSVLIKEHFLVKDVSFSMAQGECLGVVGEDGSGKSSLIKAITGSLPISDGFVRIDGKDIKDHPKILNEVSICLDPPVFFKFQSVMENMEYLCSLAGKNNKQRILDTLDKFNLLEKKNKKVYSLSYYERKLMALALAFINESKFLIIDEPFKSLPVQSIQTLRHYIAQLREKGTTIIITSKNYDSLEDQCDRYMFMVDRQVKEILHRKECEKFSTAKTFAFVAVKYPHYCGKLVAENFNLSVKLFGNRVLFDANEDTTAEIVKFFTKNKLSVYGAGYLNRKGERILANLTPYFKENK